MLTRASCSIVASDAQRPDGLFLYHAKVSLPTFRLLWEASPCFEVVCNDVQKQLEIDSVAVSENKNKQQLSEAGQQDQSKGAKEEKV